MSSFDPNRPAAETWLHFTGVAGSGMSALAQYHALGGGITTGSDRAFDRDQQPEMRARLERLGVRIVPQDGRFLQTMGDSSKPSAACAAVVASTAIEAKIPDLEAAQAAGVPILHRSELLAHYVASHRTIAITGTSGKSTVTAMVFTLLRDCGEAPGLLTGGALAGLTAEGHIGNAWAPGPTAGTQQKPWLVIEADESDGSLVRYHPWAGAVLNLGLDHKEPAIVLEMFRTFSANTDGPFLVALDSQLSELRRDGFVFGLASDAGSSVGPDASQEGATLARNVRLEADGSTFEIDGVEFRLPVPGRFNVLNATAAVALCRRAGLELEAMRAPLANYGGVARRFQSLGTAHGVEVIDDFAHNPDKIAAALATARNRLATTNSGGRVLAFFQPHGFGPTRFLRQALVEMFEQELAADDILWLPEIFFAGGTVTQDISSADLVADLVAAGKQARFEAARADLVSRIAEEAKSGDLVLVMGARDPSLTEFGRSILAALN